MLDLVLHLDVHLLQMVADYGTWIYAILFAIIFCETGLVITPFLPGDSLLFVAGAVAALGQMDVNLLFALLAAAAFLGNMLNYAVGRSLARHYLGGRGLRWLNPRHLERASDFYERYGGFAVILSRFMPIIRTYVPFVAGLVAMAPRTFTIFNAVGAVLWIGGLAYAGYFFGNIPWVRSNLTAIILGIVVVSLLPIAVALLSKVREART